MGVEVFPACELLQHLHGQHKDLPQAFLLQGEGGIQGPGLVQAGARAEGAGNGSKQGKQRRADLEQALAAAVELHAEADAAGLTGAGKLGQQSGQDGAGQGLLQHRGV